MADNYEIIPAVKQPDLTDRCLNVAAYCRVSTEHDEQINSLEAQQKFFLSLIKKNPNWKFVGLFADKGKSGTSRKQRKEFNHLIAMAERGEVDLILAKEVSRFGRNVVDTCGIARDLAEKGVYIRFTTDELTTDNAHDMAILTDRAAQAERESVETSKRVKWGQMEAMKQGIVFGRDLLGYHVQNGELSINYEEAPIVQMIYRLYLNGDGTHVIARKLQEAGYRPMNPDGKAKFKNGWSNTVILRVLRNEKYCGDLLQKKTFTPNALTHKKKYNRGEEDMVLLRDHHEPIIDREAWEAVQKELARRSPSSEQKSKHSNRYWCSGKIVCGICGGKYVSHVKKLKTTDRIHKTWQCFAAVNHGKAKRVTCGGKEMEVGCDNRQVNERVLRAAIQMLLDYIADYREELKAELLAEIQTVKSVSEIQQDKPQKAKLEKELAILTNRLKGLRNMRADGEISADEFAESKQEYEKEIQSLRDELTSLEDTQETQQAEAANRLQAYIDAIDEILSFSSEESNECIYKVVTEQIIVYPDHVLEVKLTCLPYSVRMHYVTSGRGEGYTIHFDSVKPRQEVSNETT